MTIMPGLTGANTHHRQNWGLSLSQPDLCFLAEAASERAARLQSNRSAVAHVPLTPPVPSARASPGRWRCWPSEDSGTVAPPSSGTGAPAVSCPARVVVPPMSVVPVLEAGGDGQRLSVARSAWLNGNFWTIPGSSAMWFRRRARHAGEAEGAGPMSAMTITQITTDFWLVS